MKLEIKHLAGYLPYGLKFFKDGRTYEIDCVYSDCSVHFKETNRIDYLHSDIKPILRPLSDLTKEIEINGEKFVPIYVFESEEDFESNKATRDLLHFKINDKMPLKWVQKLLEWHFDIHGLIENNLAVDINTL